MNNSWRACPALSAIAFQPFVVGTVTRIRTFPFASLTGLMTPGTTERTVAEFSFNRTVSRSRTPSMMLCSIFSLSCAVRSLS